MPYCKHCKDQKADHITSDHPSITMPIIKKVRPPLVLDDDCVFDESKGCPVCAARREKAKLKKRKQRKRAKQ